MLRILIIELAKYVTVPIIYIITRKRNIKIMELKGLRTIKRIAVKSGFKTRIGAYSTKQSHVNYAELDSHADTTCLGSTFVPKYFTGEECDVSPYLSEYKPMKGIRAASACTAYDNEDTGETIIIDVNQGLYFGDRMEESLVNPNQIRNYGLYLNDNSFEPGELLGINDYESDISIPFVVQNGTVSFKTITPTKRRLSNADMWNSPQMLIGTHRLWIQVQLMRRRTGKG